MRNTRTWVLETLRSRLHRVQFFQANTHVGFFDMSFFQANTHSHVAIFLDLQDRRTFAPLQSQHACKIGNSFPKMLTNFGRRPRARGHLYFLVLKFARFCQTSAKIESNTCIFFPHFDPNLEDYEGLFGFPFQHVAREKQKLGDYA